MKKTVAFLLALILMLTNLGAVLAETISAPPADQISATSGFASVEKKFFSTRETAAKGAPSIILVRASIKKSSSSSITVSAVTETMNAASQIGGYMNIQRWMNNKWTTYKTVRFWEYYASYASAKKTVTVPSGYYYRLNVKHVAVNGDGVVGKSVTTTSVFVN